MTMEGIKSPEQLESREKFGRNVEILATFMRHGPRAEMHDITARTLISEKGEQEVREIGKRLEVKRHGIKTYTSPVERTVRTAELVLEKQEQKGTKIYKTRKRSELGLWSASDEFTRRWVEITNENLPPNFEELQGDAKQEAFDKAEDKALDEWLRLKEQRPDETTPSPQEVAAGVAKLVDRYIKMADRLYSDSEIDLLNTSHKGTLEPLLKEILLRKIRDKNNKEQVVRGFESIEEIGGGMRPSESWQLLVKTDENENKNVKLLFRGQEYDIDMDRLGELISSSSKQ